MPKKILLADDSITIQKVVELTFSDGDYEVTAVNNGARAIQKLSEFRPDIILSDIIMPEKNGYEVCEFVKSHPEYRTIPVVLLTGTFEPFDPDRADKAGCDAVVTKPFESQSLIHKVEELIEQSRGASPASAPQPAAAAPPPTATAEPEPPSPWAEEPAPAPASEKASEKRSPADIFGSTAPTPGLTTEMPFSSPPPPAGGETQAFPPMSSPAPDASATTQQFTPPSSSEEAASPWDTPPPSGGETRAFPKMSFEDMQQMAAERSTGEEREQQADDSPFGAPPPAEEFSGETRAFPRMNFADLEKGAPSQPAPEERAPAGGEARAFPKDSFEQLSQNAGETPAASETEPAWGAAPEPAPPGESEERFSAPAPTPFDAPSEPAAPEPEEPAWSAAPAASAATSSNGVELTDDQVDRIARRVIQLMSDQVVRSIAWEVIPDMAEMVVKERIRQLENEG